METRKCSKCEERKPINEFYKKGFNKQGIQQYSSRCRQCQAEYHAKYYAVKKRNYPAHVSMEISAELANEAFPQLDPKN